MAVGVVVVTYNAGEVVLDCLESLIANRGVDLRIVVVDNASGDDTVAIIRDWAAGRRAWVGGEGLPFTPIVHGQLIVTDTAPAAGAGKMGLIVSPENHGFAGGVNLGLKALMALPEVEQFWVLNPDCMAENETAAELLAYSNEIGRFGVIGGRVYYTNPPLMIQSEGGRINLWTGTCVPYNLGAVGRDVPSPKNGSLDYFSGAHMFVSREFITRAGLMPESYFLYYEEMDWCMRRGDLALSLCPKGAVHHIGGHTIGSATLEKGPSAMAAYFMGRSRMKFIARFRPVALPVAFAYAAAKALRHLIKGQSGAGLGLLRGIMGLPPTRAVKKRIGRAHLPAQRK